MPGYSATNPSTVTLFSGMQIQSADTHTFRAVPCYLARYGPDYWRYQSDANSCTSVTVYTNPQ
ncbi:MAG: hypothetical protein RLZZ623_2976 [Actinomycetota bacterium]|jgi:hypothetical protein